MLIIGVALLIGVVAGLRAMMAPAAVSWAAYLGWLPLQGTGLSFLGSVYTPYIFSVLALGELVTDQLPSTPSRKTAPQLITRLVSGAFCGTAIGLASGQAIAGAVAGAVGAAIGTFGGAAARARLAEQFGSDRPAAIIEDIVAVVAAALLIAAVR